MNFFAWFYKFGLHTIDTLYDTLSDLLKVPKELPRSSYAATFISPKTVLAKHHLGFCISGTKNLSLKNSYQNALIIGGTGTGKSSTVLLPSLFTMQGSFIVHDPSG